MHHLPGHCPGRPRPAGAYARYAQEMQANLGGTELLQPLEYIFREKTTSGLPRQVFVLTDGAVSNIDACVRKMKENAITSR